MFLCLALVSLAACVPQATCQELTLLDILKDPLGGSGLPQPDTPQRDSPQPTSQQQGGSQQSGSQNELPSLDLGALPSNSIGQSSVSTGNAGSPSSSLDGLFPPGPQGHCSIREKQFLFRKCGARFGMAHMRYFGQLASQHTCMVNYFNCRQVNSLVGCINSIPTSDISNKCWPAVPDAFTDFLHKYKLPCTFEGLKNHCKHSATELIPADQRPQGNMNPRRRNYLPVSSRRTSVQRMVMSLLMMSMMGAGGFGGFFGV